MWQVASEGKNPLLSRHTSHVTRHLSLSLLGSRMEKKTIKKPKRAISRKPQPIDLDSMPPGDPRTPTDASNKKMPPATLTPYAERLLSRANGSGAAAASSVLSSEWIPTASVAKLTGYSQRHIRALCDQGFLIEGREWKQRPPCPGCRQGGRILIRRSALKKLETEW
jgi:hypothetical protein